MLTLILPLLVAIANNQDLDDISPWDIPWPDPNQPKIYWCEGDSNTGTTLMKL